VDVLTQTAFPPDATAARRQHSRWRQRIESLLARLTDTFHLSFPGARTYPGLLLRLAAKVAAFNLAVWLNHRRSQPPFAVAALNPC
jgi:hypothetical protein